MATSTSVPQTTSSQFKHYDPTLLNRTKSKAKSKVTGHTTRRDHTEEATYSLGLLHQDTKGDLHAIPRQTPQVQAAGHIADVEEINSATCGLFGADHRIDMYDLASGDGRYQLCRGLLNEGVMDYATRVATEESGTAKEHHSAAEFQPSNKASDPKENSYDLTASREGDYVSRRGNLGAAVERAFSVGDIESPCHERSLETFFGIVDVANGLSTTRKRSRESSNVDSTTIPPAAVPSFIPDPEREVPYPAKRHRLAERQAQSPILEPASAPNSTPLLDLSAGDGTIPSPLGAGREGDGAMSLVLPLTDLRDVEDGDGAYVQGAVEELLQARRSSSPSEGMEGEQDVGWEFDRLVMNRQGSGSKVGENFEDELSHNNEACNTPPAKSPRRSCRPWALETGRERLSTALRLLDCNTVPTRAPQQVRSSQPQQKSIPRQPGINKGPQSCSPRLYSPGMTAGDGININHESGLGMSCQITDLTLCAIPNGSSIVTAILRHGDPNWSPDLVALDHKFLGEKGKVIRITQLSPGLWMLLGYRCDDGALDLCDRRGLNAEWISSSHSDASSHGTDHSDDDSDEEDEEDDEEDENEDDEKDENEEAGPKEYSQRTNKLWLESNEVLLFSLKDKQGMEWKEVCKRFPGRSPGAVKVRYYTLRKKNL